MTGKQHLIEVLKDTLLNAEIDDISRLKIMVRLATMLGYAKLYDEREMVCCQMDNLSNKLRKQLRQVEGTHNESKGD